MQRQAKSTWTILIIAVFVSAIVYLVLIQLNQIETSTTQKAIGYKLDKEKKALATLQFNLSDPEQAPPELKNLVMKGFQIVLNTPQEVPAYAGDRLSCTNCHLAGGNTLGGKGGGISLAGIAASYPKYNEKAAKVIDLPARINYCFTRSMNGKPLPLESEDMLALVSYLTWISKGFPIYEKIPWIGVKSTTQKVPDPQKGKQLYMASCADCHGVDGLASADQKGEAGRPIPPVWGPQSFNDGAGMNDQGTLASFIYNNMPYLDPGLSEDDAADIAAFIREQPRPHYTPAAVH